MNFYKINDNTLVNLDSIDFIQTINGNNIYSEYVYQINTKSGNQLDITKKQYENIILILTYGNHLKNESNSINY